MVPGTLVNPLWWLAPRLLQLATGLATTSMVLALGPAGGQAVTVAPPTALAPAVLTVAHDSGAAPAAQTAEPCDSGVASIVDRQAPLARMSDVHLGQLRQRVSAHPMSPVRPTHEVHGRALGQRAPPAA